MIRVYFESKNHAELVAIFDTEEQYAVCIEALEKLADENRMFVTEAINDEPITDLINE